MGTLAQFLPLVLLVVLMYFLLIRPQKKREKQTAMMRNSVRVGDEVVTIGGIRGKIVKTKDDTLVIEVGADKVKFEIMRWAISKVEGEATTSKRVVEEDDDFEEAAPKKVMPKRMKKSASPAKESADGEIEEVEAEVVSDPLKEDEK
ncbi:MAG: preprotein translocase subunit YajC [Anaerovoracaceae bacterium]|jgi:preprotein translocase subunit YajC|nr:preprotein translocase subunit YajC [Anaerovoracaceae bacterium]